MFFFSVKLHRKGHQFGYYKTPLWLFSWNFWILITYYSSSQWNNLFEVLKITKTRLRLLRIVSRYNDKYAELWQKYYVTSVLSKHSSCWHFSRQQCSVFALFIFFAVNLQHQDKYLSPLVYILLFSWQTLPLPFGCIDNYKNFRAN